MMAKEELKDDELKGVELFNSNDGVAKGKFHFSYRKQTRSLCGNSFCCQRHRSGERSSVRVQKRAFSSAPEKKRLKT